MAATLQPIRLKQLLFHLSAFSKPNKNHFIVGKFRPVSTIRCSSSSPAAAVAGGRSRRPSSSQTSTSDREAVRAIRIKKVQELRSKGFDAYAYKWERTHAANQLQEIYKDLGNGEEATGDSDRVSIAGRIVARRAFGKLAFLTLRDDSGTIQLYCEKERLLSDQFENLKTLVDIGDILGAEGSVKRTEKGELSVCVTSFSILTKSLLPLPDKFHGLTDIDKRYRQRYVDMIANPEVADVFRKRAKIISEIRKTVESAGFIEVETPVLQGAAGGAEARPFITYHNSLGQDLYLRIATELHLKRMLFIKLVLLHTLLTLSIGSVALGFGMMRATIDVRIGEIEKSVSKLNDRLETTLTPLTDEVSALKVRMDQISTQLDCMADMIAAFTKFNGVRAAMSVSIALQHSICKEAAPGINSVQNMTLTSTMEPPTSHMIPLPQKQDHETTIGQKDNINSRQGRLLRFSPAYRHLIQGQQHPQRPNPTDPPWILHGTVFNNIVAEFFSTALRTRLF